MNKITLLHYHQDGGDDNWLVHGFKDQSSKLKQTRSMQVPELKWRPQPTKERLTLDP